MAITKEWLEKEIEKLTRLEVEACYRKTVAQRALMAAKDEFKNAGNDLRAIQVCLEEWNWQLNNFAD